MYTDKLPEGDSVADPGRRWRWGLSHVAVDLVSGRACRRLATLVVQTERHSAMAKLNVGDRAPDFTLPSHDGREVSLQELYSENVVVLFFYPKDGSPVCTKEACAFRDAYEDFSRAGAVVVGVSADPAERHQAFAQANRLPFVLLSDPGREVAKAYGVSKTLGLLPGRVTFVIDSDGIVRHQFRSQLGAEEHVQGALQVVAQLAKTAQTGRE